MQSRNTPLHLAAASGLLECVEVSQFMAHLLTEEVSPLSLILWVFFVLNFPVI